MSFKYKHTQILPDIDINLWMQEGRVDNRRREKNNERVHCDKGTRSYYRPSWVWEGPWSQKASWVIEGNVWFDADVESSWQQFDW